MLDLENMTTESRNARTINLDQMTPLEIAGVMNQEDGRVIEAVKKVLPQVAAAVKWCTESLRNGGRIIYMGAGTSGRMGLLDAVECPPTFGVSPDVVIGLIAGGEYAFVKAAEGAEDSQITGVEDLKRIGLTSRDTVIGIAASGRTPYVVYGLKYAKKTGCKTAVIVCNHNSPMAMEADLAIEPIVGPEVLTGSTRLKCGTAQKMVLNMISTASMVGIGKAYQNLMVDVVPTNDKLKARAENMVMMAAQCGREEAREALEAAEGNTKLAITKVLLHCEINEARRCLERADGHIREALNV
ncbi:N-acetylmuramic acid 6-phosphate etherase [Clostridium sp. MCC353]|uniref:N-acetylmuramic acid 6-phosphate etherase n=1 Tax=Clostridium sp. MCC353 TaxID=2592646 RepID=UPI001C02A685|nr:N-acetylmuramic acid 6-phosphate etherase [Clostridium sp. MCC353]